MNLNGDIFVKILTIWIILLFTMFIFFCFNLIERKVPLNIFVRSALKVPEDTPASLSGFIEN